MIGVDEKFFLDRRSVEVALKILNRMEKSITSTHDKNICYGYRAALEDLGVIEETIEGESQ